MRVYIAVLESKAKEEGKKQAREELINIAKYLDQQDENKKPQYFIFGEQACKDIDVITERKFINRYGSNGTENCYPFEYIEGKTTAPDLLHAMNGSFDFSIISERLYKLLTK